MITNYYTLRAVAEEERLNLAASELVDAFSPAKDELSLAFKNAAQDRMLRISVKASMRFVFGVEGYNRPRRNVATLFEEALHRQVTGLRIAERDRIVYLDLKDGLTIQILPFGPRANVLLVQSDGVILEAFQRDAELCGQPAPEPDPAPLVNTAADFESRWRTDRKTVAQAVAAAFPLLDRTLAGEAVRRAGVVAQRPADCTGEDRRRLFDAAQEVIADLERPEPRIYWNGSLAEAFSLADLQEFGHLRAERFGSVNMAVAVYVRRALAQEHFRKAYDPLKNALSAAAEHHSRSAGQMLAELSKESRADRYEHWGHLLMASAAGRPAGQDEIVLPDLFAGDTPITVPLNPALNAVENAQHYYDRARRTRQAHLHAEERLVATERAARETEALLEILGRARSVQDVESFKQQHASQLAKLIRSETADIDRLPFRRYQLEGDYEVWVGKNAQQNDLLTFRYAQKYDLWMHARGVAGSHAVLRLPNRHARPGKGLLERAASIAAYHSKAQGSGLVPVIVTERKYVRKPKGALPGAVIVEREDVLIVEPKLPGN